MSKTIFVSCGQETPEEKGLAEAICKVIDTIPELRSFYAGQVQGFDALTTKIFEALLNCSGMVAVLQPRGVVRFPEDSFWGVRSSVWINQEIAILAFRQHTQRLQKIPLLTFMSKDIKLEGAMTGLITNPHLLGTQEEVIRKVTQWLSSTEFPATAHRVSQKLFQEKWDALTFDALLVLDVLVEEGMQDVRRDLIKRALRERHGLSKEHVADTLPGTISQLSQCGLVKEDLNSLGVITLSVHPTYQEYVVTAIHLRRSQLQQEGTIGGSAMALTGEGRLTP